MSGNPYYEQAEKWRKDPKNWKLGFLYYNKEDARTLVSKRESWAGITINFANPKSYLVLLASACFFGFIIYMIDKKGH